MSNKIPVTVSYSHEDVKCVVTQQYIEEFNTGHYFYAIFDSEGNIIDAGGSTGGAPRGKVDKEKALNIIKTYFRTRA